MEGIINTSTIQSKCADASNKQCFKSYSWGTFGPQRWRLDSLCWCWAPFKIFHPYDLGLIFCIYSKAYLYVCLNHSWPIIFLHARPHRWHLHWVVWVLFSRREIFTNCASLLFQLELFPPGKTAFCLAKMDVKHWRERKAVFIAKKTAFCFCQKKKKKAKHMRQNHKYFPVCKPCENVLFHQWREYFPTLLFPVLKIMISMVKVLIYTYKTSWLQSNIVTIIIKHVDYISSPM